MRKVLLLLFIASVIVSGLHAQEKKTRHVARLGLKTGINSSNFDITGEEKNTMSSGQRTGFMFGTFVEMKISDNMYFQPELLYSSMGGNNHSALNGEDDLRLNYLAIPVSLKFEFMPKFKLSGGMQLSWIIQAKNFRYENGADVTSSIRNNDIAVQGGLEYWPTGKVSVGVKYIHGLSDIAYYSGTKAFNQGFQFSAGIKL